MVNSITPADIRSGRSDGIEHHETNSALVRLLAAPGGHPLVELRGEKVENQVVFGESRPSTQPIALTAERKSLLLVIGIMIVRIEKIGVFP
jgi:hypothetical protein